MGRKKKVIIGITIIAVMAVFVIVAVINTKNEAAFGGASGRAVPVQVTNVVRDNIVSKVTTNGYVEAKTKENIYTNASLKVDKVNVETGDEVKTGDILITYDSQAKDEIDCKLKQAKINLTISELNLKSILLPASQSEMLKANLNMEQAKTNYEQTQRQLKQAKDDFSKSEKLYKSGVISLIEFNKSQETLKTLEEKLGIDDIQLKSAIFELDNVNKRDKLSNNNLDTAINMIDNPKEKNQAEIYKNQIELAKIEIEQLEKKLKECTNTISPISGTIILVNVKKGDITNPSTPVIQVADLSKLVVKSYVSEYDGPNIKIGQEVEITGDFLGDIICSGTVKKVAPAAEKQRIINTEEVVIPIEIEIIDNDNFIRDGCSVDAEIITQQKDNVIVLPIISVVEEEDNIKVVYIVNNSNRVEKREINTGAYSELNVEVDKVNENEKVIINPTPKIKDGILVKPIINETLGGKK